MCNRFYGSKNGWPTNDDDEPHICRTCPDFTTYTWAGDDCGTCDKKVDAYAAKHEGGRLTKEAFDAGGIVDADQLCTWEED